MMVLHRTVVIVYSNKAVADLPSPAFLQCLEQCYCSCSCSCCRRKCGQPDDQLTAVHALLDQRTQIFLTFLISVHTHRYTWFALESFIDFYFWSRYDGEMWENCARSGLYSWSQPISTSTNVSGICNHTTDYTNCLLVLFSKICIQSLNTTLPLKSTC